MCVWLRALGRGFGEQMMGLEGEKNQLHSVVDDLVIRERKVAQRLAASV